VDVNWKALLAAGFTGIGAAAVAVGVHAIYPPAAWIFAGAILMAAGLLPDWGA
jgi:hypothetical protein